MVVIQEQAFVGGKTVANRRGNLVDFLMKNQATHALALIEIKTPKTPLLGGEYRSGVYNISRHLTGAVQQVLTYRQTLIEEGHHLLREFSSPTTLVPRCIVIAGNTRTELDTDAKRRAFELYRSQLPGIELIAYDEMAHRTKRLIRVLEDGIDSASD